MKNKICLILGTLVLTFWIVTCDREEAFEPDPSINIAELGNGIYINESDIYGRGIAALFVNEGDTTTLTATSILLNKPNYTWSSADPNVLKLIKDEQNNNIVYAVAMADSGAGTTLTITDLGNNNAKKNLPVTVTKYWADPGRFTFVSTFNGHFYYISTDIKTWSQADVICQEAGGHLATITTPEEQNVLFDNRGPIENAWIGVRFVKNASGTWVVDSWVTGEEITYRNFVGNTSDPGIFAEYFFYMDVNGQWESWHEISYNYFLEME